MAKGVKSHFKDYDSTTDSLLSISLMKLYRNELADQFQPDFLMNSGDINKTVAELYQNSIFNEEDELLTLLESKDWEQIKKLEDDSAFSYMKQFYDVYFDEVRPEYSMIDGRIDSLYQIYVKGMREFVDGRYYPDANSTLRLSYGKVEDYKPRDGVDYHFFTTTAGIVEKYDPSNVDFDLPDRLLDLIRAGDYGPYADKDGSMKVCFLASNHTTGGNSGSPVINGKGQLVGLNFDRNWEGTMSDINYDINLCRNISVDIRYVLFVVDKYAGAKHLIEEMELVSK